MLYEIHCNKTHRQFLIPDADPNKADICLATVRVEYAEAVKAAIEAQLSLIANKEQSRISTEEK